MFREKPPLPEGGLPTAVVSAALSWSNVTTALGVKLGGVVTLSPLQAAAAMRPAMPAA